MNVNIGGGKQQHEGWVNFDAQTGYRLSANTVFPVETGTADIVYSSHCFEHLDDATVSRMLTEAHRMLAPSGVLVLKLPDFEQVLERWRAGDEGYFGRWGMHGVIPTWKNLGVPVNIDSKAAMIFCGWWNDAYGDEFGERHPDADGAYHGPAIRAWHWYATNPTESPHELSALMRESVPAKAHFNHRNAWSRAEMWGVLIDHHFHRTHMTAETATIPGYHDQQSISAFYHARPV